MRRQRHLLSTFVLGLGIVAGCGEATNPNLPIHGGVRGYPTIVAQKAVLDDGSLGTRLTLHNARVIFASEPNEPRDLSIFRTKTVLLLQSRKQATFLAALVDADLATQGTLAGPASQDAHPCELRSGEYGLVSVAADGTLSSVDTKSVTSVRIVKSGAR